MNLSADGQLRYVVQWFQEWSELQRDDFRPILAENLSNVPYVNGLVDRLASLDTAPAKPMSLFECRVKLFREWYQQWDADHKDKLMTQLANIDPAFVEKLHSEMQNGHPSPPIANGIQHASPQLADNEV